MTEFAEERTNGENLSAILAATEQCLSIMLQELLGPNPMMTVVMRSTVEGHEEKCLLLTGDDIETVKAALDDAEVSKKISLKEKGGPREEKDQEPMPVETIMKIAQNAVYAISDALNEGQVSAKIVLIMTSDIKKTGLVVTNGLNAAGTEKVLLKTTEVIRVKMQEEGSSATMH